MITIRLKDLQEVRGLTQIELAHRAGLRHATINMIERGRTKGIDFETLERMEEALEVDPALLIARVAEAGPLQAGCPSCRTGR